MSKKGSIILTVVLSVLCAALVIVVYKYLGISAMLGCCIVFLAVSNLITAVGHEKLSKKVKDLEQKVDELTKNQK
ncbi:MAG: hypothetical protein II457_02005 [Paludibacteraceae bacterium]|nr:hypothetical protein [Paludibacteraceae bacterium]